MKNEITIPQYVEWQITAQCNLNCIHCVATHRAPQNDLSTPAAISLVHELLDQNIKSITLTGGEPLLRSDFELLAEILKENNVSVQVISNGLALDEKRAQQLARLGINFVWLNLDGPRQTHNAIRQHPDAFDKVLNAASLLEKMAVPYGFMTTLLSTNYDQIGALGEIVQTTSSALWQIWLGNKCNNAPIWPTVKQIQQIIQELLLLRTTIPQLIIGDNIGYSSPLEALRMPNFPECCSSARFTGCYGAKTIVGILNDGSIKGCLSMPDEGNVATPEEYATLSERYRQAAKLHHESVNRALRQCRGCTSTEECNGGCPAWAITSGEAASHRFCYIPPTQSPRQTLCASALSASLITLCTLATPGCHTATTAHPSGPTTETDASAPLEFIESVTSEINKK